MQASTPNPTVEQTTAAIERLDLDPIKFKLMDPEEGYGWSQEYADRMELAYKRFLVLLTKYPDETIAPTKDIDKFWHGHILDTLKYTKDCEELFGSYLHHFPYFGMRGEADAKDQVRASNALSSLYEKEFGETLSALSAFCIKAPARDAAFCIKAPEANRDSAFCIKANAAVTDSAFCIKAPESSAGAAFCIKAPAANSAFCIKAPEARLNTAFCIKASALNSGTAFCIKAPETAQNSAFCIKAPEAKIGSAFCIKATQVKADAAFCIRAPGGKTESAFCIKARAAKSDAAFCIKAPESPMDPAFCIKINQDQARPSVKTVSSLALR